MQALLKLSKSIDWLSTGVGKLGMWLILVTTVISAGNAIVRKVLNTSSNALLEVQWYLFAAVFMLCAGYCLLKNAHVRIDFIAAKLSARTRNWIDVGGIVLVLFPFCYICIRLGWPMFIMALESGEMSQNSGGLIRWPVYALIPLGFGLLMLQGLSELIKRVAFLRGAGPDALAHDEGHSEEEALLAALVQEHERATASATSPSKAE